MMMSSMRWPSKINWQLSRETEILIIILVAWVSFKALWLAPRFSDGNVYMYLGHLIAQGSLPYRDFFYSSPPLLLYISAIWGKLFGFTWQSFDWLPLVATIIEAGLVYDIGKLFWSGWVALVGVCLYLTSLVVLGTTDFASDIHIVSLFCTSALALALKDRPRWAGVFLALAMLTKIYAGVILIVFILWYLWQKRWGVLANFTTVWAIVFGIINGLWWGLVDHQYVQLVFLNNLHRGLGIAKLPLWQFLVTHDFILLTGFLFALYFWRRLPSWLLLGLTLLPAFYLLYPDIYFLYFKLWAVYLALAWSWGIYMVIQRWPSIRLKQIITSLVVIIMVGMSWMYTQTQARISIIDNLSQMIQYVQDTTQPADQVYGDFTLTPLLALLSGRSIVGQTADTNIKFFNQGIFAYYDRAQQLRKAQVPLIVTVGIVGAADGGLTLTGGSVDTEILKPCHVDTVFPITQDYDSNAVIMWRCQY